MIELGQEDLNDFEKSASREWLETNGIGGYALSSISGANTRRYHGLLVAATKPPLGRTVLLSKLEETLLVGDEQFDLSTNQYPGTIHPQGFRHIKSFRLDPFPVWTCEAGGVILEKRVFMVHGENTIVCRWSKVSRTDARLIIRPLVAFRDHHHLNTAPPEGRFDVKSGEDFITIEQSGQLISLSHNAVQADVAGRWYFDLEYAIEMERGFEFRENLFSPCAMEFDLAEDACVIASTQTQTASSAAKLERAEVKRRAKLVAAAKAKTPFHRHLVLAADQFVVDRGKGKSVIAGYPWFSDWGRDTMIALPGLTLATNRPEIAKDILAEFARHISNGMLPNRFPDEGETPDYNTVDATLWFFEAVRAYIEKTGDYGFARELYPKLAEIVDAHIAGTRFDIRVDTDGLLLAGDGPHNLTWMDAKIGESVVTPRFGKAVEIQALWYNALLIMAGLAQRFEKGERVRQLRSMAATARDSFNGQFWNADGECLYDVVNGGEADSSIRPNQIIAVSLPHSMLETTRARKVVEKVAAELLTPRGLRSLAPGDSQYTSIYSGPPNERDGAYHQGTVWAWLIGPYITAFRRVHAKDKKAEKYVAGLLDAFEGHMKEACVGQVSEIFDAQSPHYPRGACAQAWSVGELLRVMSA
jgi:predicted glycogen debranching enzyme